MIDLHSHLLPELDDGAVDINTALEMARLYVKQGVNIVACTPHIMPGLYPNTGVQIQEAVQKFQYLLDEKGIALELYTGADNHIIPDFVSQLKSGNLLSLANSRYVLVEPPHHVAPTKIERFFFDIIASGYTPILTHPERLKWIEHNYAKITQLGEGGVWMQVTSGSLRGRFGQRVKYWAERMVSEGRIDIIATDAHNLSHRAPDLFSGIQALEKLIGSQDTNRIAYENPKNIIKNNIIERKPRCSSAIAAHGGNQGLNKNVKKNINNISSNFARRLRQFIG